MKFVGHVFKHVNTAVLALSVGVFSLNSLANPLVINTSEDKSYRPVAKTVPELAQIVFYYPQGAIPATINVDGELQSALLPGEFTVFCVAPGNHTIASYFQDQPLYRGKQNIAHKVNVAGAGTYFLQANTGGSGTTAALVERPAAEAELATMRKQVSILNRASQVIPCEYVNGDGVILIQENVQFRFGESDYSALLPSAVVKLENVIAFIKQGNNVTDIQVLGYTDAIGDLESNHQLSQARANTIREVLLRKGVNAEMISNVNGMGVAQSAEGCVAKVSQQNLGCNVNSRRVDIIVR